MAATTQLAVARAVVSGKIRNQRYMMRRHDLEGRTALASAAKAALAARSNGELFGVKGAAAQSYFAGFGGAIKKEDWQFEGRVRRPARDRVNAALNLTYGLLLADVLRAVVACGLDPAGGALHSSGRNKPALALDLMEELRPLIADSAVLWAINNGELKPSDFRTDLDAVRLTPRGRKALIAAYERRANSEFVHPLFRYRVTWRRAMEIQARMFMAVVSGERAQYEPIVMR
jgi:CRISPR-associated protein Cas1